MKKRILILFVPLLLKSCFLKKRDVGSPFAGVMDTMEVDDISSSEVRYTKYDYPEEQRNSGIALYDYDDERDYEVVIGGEGISISVSKFPKFVIAGNVVMDGKYNRVTNPTNSNFIFDKDRYLYFNGQYLYEISEELEVISKKFVLDENTEYGSAIRKDDYGYVLYVPGYKYNSVIHDYDIFVMVTTIDHDFNIVNQNRISTGVELPNVSFANTYFDFEFDAFYDENMNQFMMKGCVYKYDELTDSYDTDGYLVLSQPKLVDGEYVYKALKFEDDCLYYDPMHVVCKESNSLQRYETLYETDYIGIDAYVHENGDIELFFAVQMNESLLIPNTAYETKIDYIRISDDKPSHFFFDETCFYAGYAKNDDVYYHEIVRAKKENCYEGAKLKYYHFPVR